MMKKNPPMPIAEISNDFFLPNVSTPTEMNTIVAASFMTPTRKVIPISIRIKDSSDEASTTIWEVRVSVGGRGER
jgi:hypothetical protein